MSSNQLCQGCGWREIGSSSPLRMSRDSRHCASSLVLFGCDVSVRSEVDDLSKPVHCFVSVLAVKIASPLQAEGGVGVTTGMNGLLQISTRATAKTCPSTTAQPTAVVEMPPICLLSSQTSAGLAKLPVRSSVRRQTGRIRFQSRSRIAELWPEPCPWPCFTNAQMCTGYIGHGRRHPCRNCSCQSLAKSQT